MAILSRLSPSFARIAAAASVLSVCWLGLPVRLNPVSSGPSNEACLTLADRPPAPGAAALAELEQCSTVVPNDVELLADLGKAYESADRRSDAERTYQTILELDPDYADVRVQLARLLLRRGLVEQARVHALEALRVQPNRLAIQQLLESMPLEKR